MVCSSRLCFCRSILFDIFSRISSSSSSHNPTLKSIKGSVAQPVNMKVAGVLAAAVMAFEGVSGHYIFQQLKVGSTQYSTWQNSECPIFFTIPSMTAGRMK